MCARLILPLYAIFIILWHNVESARILGVFPIPSLSHQVVFSKYTEVLAERGHELVVITPNPDIFNANQNVTIIDVSIGYKYMVQFFEEELAQKLNLKRGVIIDTDFVSAGTFTCMLNILDVELKQENVQKILNDKSQRFDLIVVEAFYDFPLYVTTKFDAPVVQMSSFYGNTHNYAAIGAIRAHPMLFPNMQRYRFKNLSFWEKMYEVYVELKLYYELEIIFDGIQNERLKQVLGANAPTVGQLRNKIDMLFLNSHPLMDNNRPVPPSVIYLGGAFHIQPRKEIPNDLKQKLNLSKRGVIYVSLGTNVKIDLMDKELLSTFINAFKSLPYDILWKCDVDNLEEKPGNVHIQKWFPQRDLLFHPNIKLFIMQGGLQSIDEAIDAEVPLVVIPFLGDQFINSNSVEELGVGIRLMTQTMTTDDIIKAANEVLKNESYRGNIAKLKEIRYDSYLDVREKAVWWTEYVIRHKGAKHLRSPLANISWSDYLMLDVMAAVISIMTLIVLVMVLVLYCIVSKLFLKKPKGFKSKKYQ